MFAFPQISEMSLTINLQSRLAITALPCSCTGWYEVIKQENNNIRDFYVFIMIILSSVN